MQATSEKLEVVGADDDDPGDDEGGDPGVAGDGPDDPDRGGSADGDGRQRGQAPVGDRRSQRSAVQLVERVSADPDGQEERCERRAEDRERETRGERRRRSRRRTGARPCRADAAASRSRASRRVRARRRPAAGDQSPRRPQRTIPPPRLRRRYATSRIAGFLPHRRAVARAGTSSRTRGCSGPGTVRPPPMPGAASPRATAGPCPRRTRHAEWGTAARGIANSSEAITPPGAHDAGKPGERRRRVVDVAEQVGERQPGEARLGERKLLRPPLLEPNARAETRLLDPRAPFCEHLRALVDPDHRAAVATRELDRHRSRAGGHVEHDFARRGLDPRDEEAPPARVLPEAQQRRVAVVGGAERSEEIARPPGALGAGDGHALFLLRWHSRTS